MPKLVLTYFDFDGGRGEAARLIMHLAGIAFEDKRIPGKDWPALRDSMPFQALPVLEVDGRVITQSNTIIHYLGKLGGLYPKDDWQSALVEGEPCLDVSTGARGLVIDWEERPWIVILREDGSAVVTTYPSDERTVMNRRGGGRWISPSN